MTKDGDGKRSTGLNRGKSAHKDCKKRKWGSWGGEFKIKIESLEAAQEKKRNIGVARRGDRKQKKAREQGGERATNKRQIPLKGQTKAETS